MILLDHNIPKDQADQLRRWAIRFKQIGYEIGRPEWQDQQEILRYLHSVKQVTFVTRDFGFYGSKLRHANYCLVVVTSPVLETASLTRRLLRRADFNSREKRTGKVVKLSLTNISWWEVGRERPQHILW